MSTDAKPADNPNVGPEPVEAKPNHVREKTYEDPTPPKPVEDALEDLPEREAEDKVRTDLPEAVEAIKKRI